MANVEKKQEGYIEGPVDYFIVMCFVLLGGTNTFWFSNAAAEYGLLSYVGLYFLVLILIGIPVFVIEVTLLMPDGDSLWRRFSNKGVPSIYWSVIIQYFATTHKIVQSYYYLSVLLLLLIMRTNVPTLSEVKSNSCQPITNKSVVDVCARYTPDMASCLMNSLLDNKRLIFVTSGFVLTGFTGMYILFTGIKWRTLTKFGWVMLMLMMMLFGTLVLQFRGYAAANMLPLMLRNGQPQVRMVSQAVIMCLTSLSVITAGGTSTIGSCCGPRVKENFVKVVLFISAADAMLSILFSISKVSRRVSVKDMCGLSEAELKMSVTVRMTRQLDSRESSLVDAAESNMLELMQTILLFSEDPSTVAWNICLILVGFMVWMLHVITSMLNFLLPLEVVQSTISRGANCKRDTVAAIIIQLAGTLVMELLVLSEYCSEFLSRATIGMNVSFFIVKMIDSFLVMRQEGLLSFVAKRRAMIPKENTVQLLIFDWYLAPCIMTMLPIGYPILTIVTLLHLGYDKILSDSSLMYISATLVLPFAVSSMMQRFTSKK